MSRSTQSSTSNEAAALTTVSATELARRIAGGEVSSREVVEAHIARIEAINDRLNAVVQKRFDAARREADQVDAAVAEGERALGPLAGVPMTIKECFDVRGMTANIGIEGLGQQPTPEDGPLVARLKAAGAIVLGKTNIPQLMSMHETDNPVYGRTNNPWDLSRSPGGSSGGEAAVIAAGGSPLGLGNDLGGSIRIPAHFCGIHGIKPTSGRLTNLGALANFRGLEAMVPQPGPLARHVDDLTLAVRLLAAEGLERIDPQVAPGFPIEPKIVSLKGLRAAAWTDDGYFTPCPAVRRLMGEAVEALRQVGVDVQMVDPPDVPEAMRLYFGIVTADGGADMRRLLGHSRRDWRVRRMLLPLLMPRWMRRAVATGLAALGHAREADTLRAAGPMSADAYWQLSYQKNLYAAAYARRLNGGGFDFVLCPTHPLPALTHGSNYELIVAGSYAMLFNLLGMPAGTVSLSRVRDDETSDRPASRDPSERRAQEVEAHSVGLPISVQVAARWWQESVVLAVMRSLEITFQDRGDYPRQPPI